MSLLAKIILVILAILMAIVMTSVFREERRRAKYKVIVYLLIFVVLFTVSSLFWTTDIAYDTETITHLEFGWPISFEVQDLSFYNPPFPYSMGVDLSGHSQGGVFLWKNFLFSIAINFALVVAVWRITTLVIFKRRS